MMINGYTMASRSFNTNSLSFARFSNPPRLFPTLSTPKPALPNLRFSCKFDPKCKLLLSPTGNLSLSFPSASPLLDNRKTKFKPPRASKDIPFSFRFPPMDKKPKFWWRILACIPYFMPLLYTCVYAETAYNLHPFLETLEPVTHRFLALMANLPSWFLMTYFFLGYLLIVRRKEWPHFFRFHVILGMLLEMFLQVLGTASRWMPKSYLYGNLGMRFWVTVAFAHLFTVLECIRCAICGVYADVPFASDAAYIHMPYD